MQKIPLRRMKTGMRVLSVVPRQELEARIRNLGGRPSVAMPGKSIRIRLAPEIESAFRAMTRVGETRDDDTDESVWHNSSKLIRLLICCHNHVAPLPFC
jgi:hypothetical protein